MNAPIVPESQVNTFSTGSQSSPKVQTLSDGTYVVVWQSEGQDGNLSGIFGQRYSAEGQRIGLEFLVNETQIEIQQDPHIAATDDGGFVIVWEARNQDQPGSFDFGIYGRKFGADGAPTSGEFLVNETNTSLTQFDASVTGLPGGGFAVSFTDDLGDGSGDGIRARIYDNAATPAAPDFQVNTEISSNQVSSDIAAIQPDAGSNGLAAGGFVVTWYSPTSGTAGDGSSGGIFAQLFAVDGTAIGTEFQVNTTTANDQNTPEATGLLGGRFVIVWQDNGGADSSGIGIFAQVFEGDGTAVGTEFLVNEQTQSSQFDPEITATTDGGFVISWTSSTSGPSGDGSFNGVFARRFDADGVAVTGEGQVNEQTTWDQETSDVAALANGNFVTVWQSDTQGTAGDGDGLGIFQRILGDPLNFTAPSNSPIVEAVSTLRVFSENALNAAPQRIDADGAAAVSDSDSVDFDGGQLIVGSLAQSVAEDDFPVQDSTGQDQLGVDVTGLSPVSIAGDQLSVNGVVIGTISSDGSNGQQLVIDLNADANATNLEIVVEHLTYQNTSDDPRPSTQISILLSDGDGGTAAPVVVDIQITPESDTNGFVREELRVNTVAENAQQNPDATALFDAVTGALNGYLVVWQSTNQDNPGDNNTGVFGQRYDANGAPAGGEFQINQTVAGGQSDPHASGLTDGGYVIVWTSNNNDGSGNGVMLTRYDAAGVEVPGQTEIVVNTETQSNQDAPRVIGLSDGGFQVVWDSVSSGTAGDGNGNGVFTQRFNAAGSQVGGEQQVNEQIESTQDIAEIAALDAGRFVIVWQSATSGAAGDGSSTGIFGRLFDDQGVPEGGEFQVNSFTNSTQTDPEIATLSGGDFVVVWRSQGQDTSSGGVFYQRYTSAGAQVGSEIRVNDATNGDQTDPSITALDTGGFVVSWTDTSSVAPGSGSDVYAQVFDTDGTRLDSAVLVNSDVPNTQAASTLAALPGGNYVVVWQSNNNPDDSFRNDIQQQIIGDPADFTISAAPQINGFPSTVVLAENTANAGTGVFAPGTIQLTDSDSADFDGGSLTLSRINGEGNEADYLSPDDENQDSLSIGTRANVSTSGSDVLVNGVVIGTVASNGQSGADLVINFNANASVDAVEDLLQAIDYSNSSDNPQPSREYALQLTDGDGSVRDPISFSIDLTQEADVGFIEAVGSEDQVNTFTTAAQSDPEVSVLADGGWVVVWHSNGQDGSGLGVFGQRFNADGSRNGPEFQVNSTSNGAQQDPVVTGTADGGWVVVWEATGPQDNPGQNDFGVIGQRYAADGTLVGTEFVVNTTINATQFDAAVATDPSGGFVVAWTTDFGDGNGDGVAYQRFDAAGAPVGAELIVNIENSGNQGNADLAVLSTGQTIVTFVSPTSGTAGDGSGVGVFGRIINADGTFATGEIPITQEIAGGQDLPDVIATAAGFAVVWQDASGQDGSGTGVQMRFFDTAGAPLTDEFTVNEGRSSTQSNPDVVVLDDGRVLVTWSTSGSSAPGGSGTDVSGQLFTATGQRIDGEFRINTEVSSTQILSHVAALPGNNFVAVWQTETSAGAGDGSGQGIFQQVFGDPADFVQNQSDDIIGLPLNVELSEDDINAGPVRLDADMTAAVPDLGGSGFDGGVLDVQLNGLFDLQNQFEAPDDISQHQFGLTAGDVGNGDVTVSGAGVGSDVLVDGVVVGTISSDGADGAALTITFNAAATNETVEAVLGNVVYSNTSDDPDSFRVAINLNDGGGVSTPTNFIEVSVSPSEDLGLAVTEERRVNAHTEGDQSDAEIAELTGGGYVVVWESTNQDELPVQAFDVGVYAQVYTADNVPVGPEILVATTIALSQFNPTVAGTADGGFVVVWEGDGVDDPGANDRGILAQQFDASGATVGVETVINTAVNATQASPSVSAFVDGGYVVSYTSDFDDGSGTDTDGDSILTQRVDAAGVLQGEIIVNTTVTGNQSSSDIATRVDPNTGFNAGYVVVWTDPAATGDDSDPSSIRGRLVDATGTPVGTDFAINTSTVGDQFAPSVASLSDGGFIVVWVDDRADQSGDGIFAQRYDAAGVAQGAEFRVNDTTSSFQSDPDVSALDGGGFVVTWNGNGNGDTSGVFAQVYDAAGARIDGEVHVNVQTSSTQNQPAVVGHAGGGFSVAYTSTTSGGAGDGNSTGVFIRSFEPVQSASVSPALSDLSRRISVGADDITGGSVAIIDDGVAFSDPDNTDFDGGTFLAYYTSNPLTTDQLTVEASGNVTVAGANISVGGTIVGTIDAIQNGANGANLLVNFSAASDAAAVQAVIEHLGFSSTGLAADNVGQSRGVGFVITDGNGGQTEPDSVFMNVVTGSVTSTGLELKDFSTNEFDQTTPLDPTSEIELLATPRLLDGDVDLEDFAGTTFDGGVARLEVSGASQTQVLSVQDQGTGAGQIGFDGTTVSYEGTDIGTIDATLNGLNASNLEIDLNASASTDAVEALLEAFTFGLSGPTTNASPSLRLVVQNGAGDQAVSSFAALPIDRNFAEVLPPELGEEQVNTFTTGDQTSPRITALADGGYVVIWTSVNQDAPGSFDRGIFGQRFNEFGEEIGAEFQLNDLSQGDQFQPRVGALENGNFVALWTESNGRDSSGQGVFGQIFGTDGNPVGTAFQVNEETSSTQNSGQITGLDGGRFLTVWSAQTSGGSGDGSGTGIFGRIFDATGTPEASEFQINTFTTSNQNRPRTTTLEDGDVLVVWQEAGGADGSGSGVFAQRVDPAGNLVALDGSALGVGVSGETQINTTTTSTQDRPDVASLDGGGFVVVWESDDGSGDGIFAQVFDTNGAPVGAETAINIVTFGTQADPVPYGTSDGGFVVVWTDSSGVDGSGTGITAQRANADGTLNGQPFVVNTEVSATQQRPELVELVNGSLVFVWSSSTSGTAGDGSSNGIFQQIIDAPALPAGAESPVLVGFVDTATFDETDVNAGLQLIDPDGVISLTDADSADFDGGSLLVARVVGSQGVLDGQLGANDGLNQDMIGLLAGNGVTLAGADVSVGGILIGSITQDGVGINDFEITFGAGATPELVERVLEQLSYANGSANPSQTRQFSVQVTDGDGGSTGSNMLTIDVNQQVDRVQVSSGPDEQVNTFTQNNQQNSQTTTLFDSVSGDPTGYVVIWESTDQDRPQDGDVGLFGQVYDINGNPVGSEFLVSEHTEFAQNDVSVVGLAGGGFVAAWSNNSFASPAGIAGGDIDNHVLYRVFDNTGATVSAESLLNDETQSTQNDVDLTALADGGFAATWRAETSGASGDGSSGGIAARTFNADGTARAGEFIANATTIGNQADSQIVELNNGNLMHVWTSTNQDNPGDGNTGVFARVTDASGAEVVAEFQVNTTVLGAQQASRVAVTATGNIVVVWQDGAATDGSANGVFQQIIAPDGSFIGGETRVNENTSSSQFEPEIAALPDGGWVVVWSDNSGRDGSGQGVFAQVYSEAGDRIDGEFQVNISQISSAQGAPSITALDGENFVITFNSFTSGATSGDGSSNGVFQQLFTLPSALVQSSDPALSGIVDQTFDEAVVNITPALLFPTLSLGDSDSADFDDGRLIIGNVQNDTVQQQFASPDNAAQDQLGLNVSVGSLVAISGTDVSVGGVVVGTLASDGADGSDLIIVFNSNATSVRIEQLIEAVTYANSSDDPELVRLVSIDVSDGDGGVFRDTVTVNITPEDDAVRAVDDEIQTNSFTPGEQSDPSISALVDPVSGDATGYVVVWTSVNQDATGDNNNGVFAQVYDVSGAPVGGELQVNTTTLSSQSNAQVIGLSTGGFAVSWQDNSSTQENGTQVMAQVFDGSGIPTGSEIFVDTDGFTQFNPAMDALDNGDFVIVRHAQDDETPFQNTIVGQRYTDAGGTVGLQFEVEDVDNTSFTNPDVAVLSNGTMIVTFQASGEETNSANGVGVFGQLFAADASIIGGPFQINTRERFTQDNARVAALDDGGFVVVYQSLFNDDFGFTSSPGVYGQRFDATGTPVGSEFLVNDIVDGTQSEPDIIAQPGGGFTVIFSDSNSSDGSGVGVFSQTYDSDGNRVDGQIQINQEISSTQSQGAIASLGGGNYVAAWRSETSATAGDGSSGGIFHRIFGDPADFSIGGDPILDGVNSAVTFEENTVNGVPQLIDSNGAAAVSDVDSTDFDGGSILVSNVVASAPLINQINAPDDLTQDILGLRQGPRITISNDDVSVDGVVVGTIVQSGQAGQAFEILLNADANSEIAELLIENLTYRNVSDDPLELRQLRIQLTDGDGGASIPALVSVTINPTVDAAVPLGGENQANTFTTGNQSQPAIATLENGDFLLVWQSSAQDGAAEGVFAQRVDRLGNLVDTDGSALALGASGEFQVSTTTAGSQYDAAVVGLPDGGFIVTWSSDTSQDGSGIGVFAQRYDATGTQVAQDGTALGVGVSGEFQVNILTSSTQDQSDVVALEGANAGQFVTVWSSFSSAGAGDGSGTGIIGQIFTPNGTSEFVINTETLSDQTAPQLTALPDGGFFVVWQSTSSGGTADGNGIGVFGQRFDALGAAQGSELQINVNTVGNQADPQVAVLDNGNLVITYSDSNQDASGQGVYARIIAPDGTPITDEFRVNDQRIGSQNQPDVTALETGGFVITWQDNNGTDGSGLGVFAQQYNANGNRIDSQVQVNTEFLSTQFEPVVTALSDGGFAIAWTSVTNGTAGDGSGEGVFYQIYANLAPVVSPVQADGDEDTPIVLNAEVFEAGFVDPDGQTLQAIRIETLPTQGTLTLGGVPITATTEVTIAQLIAGDLVYLGNPDFFGDDQFLWTGSDGISFANDLVEAEISVAPVNDAPGLEAGPDVTLAEGGNLIRQLQLSDPDADNRTFTVDYGDGSPVEVFNSASLTPNLSHVFGGEGSFTVSVSVDDNAGEANSVESDSFTVLIENAAPNAVSDGFAFVGQLSTDEDSVSATFDPLVNDTDPGNDPLTLTLVEGAAFAANTPINLASGAILTVDGAGLFNYDPNGQFEQLAVGQTAFDTFTYTIEDDGGLTDQATVRITVTGVNDDPDAADDALVANDDTAIVANVLADNGNGADADVDNGTTLTVIEINGVAGDVGNQIVLASGATITLQSDGTLDYDPTTLTGTTTADSFEYTISDGDGGTDTATVNLTINATNQAPDAVDDAFTTDEDTSIVNGDVFAANPTTPDSDPDGDTLSVVEVDGVAASVSTQIALASGALLTLNSDGTFDYDPNGQFEDLAVGSTATDGFAYTIQDGNGGSDTASVTITIDGANDGPIVGGIFDTATEDGAAVTGNLLSNSSDIDVGDMLSLTEINGSALVFNTPLALASGATLTVQTDGSYSYDPGTGFQSLALGDVATDIVQFRVADGNGGSGVANLQVDVTGVNDAPEAQDDDFTVGEDAPLAGNLLNDNDNGADSDVDAGDNIVLTEVNGSAADVGTQITLASGALLTVNASGTFTYDQNGAFDSLAAGQTDTETFTYTIDDDEGVTSTATATITIQGNADDPVALDDSFATTENGNLSEDVLADNGAGADFDPDAGTVLSVAQVNGVAANVGGQITLASGALLTMNSDGTFDYDTNGAFDALAALEIGADSFTYTVSDGAGGEDTATVSIELTGENDAPVANDDAFGIDEDDPAFVDNVFANNGSGSDFDVDNGDTLTVTAINGSAAGVGTQLTLASGALLTLESDGEFTFETNAAYEALSLGQTTTETFTYQITDASGATDTATASVEISGENDDPDAVDDTFQVIVDQTFTGNVIAGVNSSADTDVDQNDTLSVVQVDGSSAAIGTPFTLASGAVVTLLATGDFTYDPTGAIFTPPPAMGAPASDSFTYTLSDGVTGTDTATVNITVQPVGFGNSAPTATAVVAGFGEDAAMMQVDLLSTANDPESDDLDVLNVSIVSSVGRTVAFIVDEETGALSIAPGQFEDLAVGQDDVLTVSYEITDGINTVANTATVTISGANDAPTLTGSALAAVEDGPSVDFDLSVLGDDVDSDDAGTSLTYTQVGDPSEGSSSITGTTLTFVPGADFQDLAIGEEREVMVSVQATDQHGVMSSIEEITVTVTGTNDAPTLIAGILAATEDGPSVDFDLSVLGDDVDSDDNGTSLTYTQVGDPSEGSSSITGTTLTFVPGAGFQDLALGEEREVTVSVQATDQHGAVSSIEDITVTVTGTNDAPTLAAGVLAATEDGPSVTLNLSTLGDDIDSDDNGTSLTYTQVGDPSEGSSSITGTTLTFVPGADFQDLAEGEEREVTVSVQATDQHGDVSSVEDVTVTVTGTNDAPILGVTGPFDVDENIVAVGTITATDADNGSSQVFSIVGGADAALFDIDATTGALSFLTAPDFESPSDVGGDNTYEVQVEVSDGSLTNDAFVFVNVQDIDEGPTGPNVIQGTGIGYEVLTGTAGEDEIRTGGGAYDVATGGGSADAFVFENSAEQQVFNILDYEVGSDTLNLGGQGVLFQFSAGNATYLYLDGGEFDTVIVNGASSLSDITFVTDDPLPVV